MKRTRIVEFEDGTFGVEQVSTFLFWTYGTGRFYGLTSAELLYSKHYIDSFGKTNSLNNAKHLQTRVEKRLTPANNTIKRVINE